MAACSCEALKGLTRSAPLSTRAQLENSESSTTPGAPSRSSPAPGSRFQVATDRATAASARGRAARAAALFGREGVAMVNLLREGSDGMEKMRQEARAFARALC